PTVYWRTAGWDTGLKHVCLRTAQETASKHLNVGRCCLTTVGIVNASWRTAGWDTGLKHVCLRTAQETASKHLNAG
ncbi:3193_t:CDS:1, partial [Cetraspora pellucida]